MNKKLISLIVFYLAVGILTAQIPRTIHYQATVRSSGGYILGNHNVSVVLSILRGSAAGQVLYSEKHTTVSNQIGTIDLAIGDGTVLSGNFSSIDWSTGPHYLKSEIDINGNGNYVLAGISKFTIMPYALYAGNMTLTDENGKKYTLAVDTSGNLISVPIEEEQEWQCGDTLTDTRDGQKYLTVQIGSQCWMARNLNVGTRIDSSVLLSNNGIIEKYCYKDDVNNCQIYGGLYTWKEAMNYDTIESVNGICPQGWHLPSESEWNVLFSYLGSITVAGGKMKETGISHWDPPNTGATNISGFTGLPAGEFHGPINNIGKYIGLKINAFWWSSTKNISYDLPAARSYKAFSTWERILIFDSWIYNDPNSSAYSVRCMKD